MSPGEILRSLCEMQANKPEGRSRWVMSPEWLSDVRRADVAGGASFWAVYGLGKPEYLLGIPIEVRADGGAPHLEPA